VWLWITLHVVCLPTIRANDQSVWKALADAIVQKLAANVLFVNAWNHPNVPGYRLDVGTPGLRGPTFPEIFESPIIYLSN
jgi:hypothetical protein